MFPIDMVVSEFKNIILPITRHSSTIRSVLVIVLFFIGAYITSKTRSRGTLPEGFEGGNGNVDGGDSTNISGGIGMDTLNDQRCPNILIQHGTEIFLYNSKVAKVPGVNPIRFKSLEDYSEFMDWLHGRGIRCPILFLQYSYDTQGNPVYKMRPSPLDLQGGLSPNVPFSPAPASLVQMMDASRDNPPFNNQMYAGFDPLNFNMGDYTTQDAEFRQKEYTMTYSDNPMDTNWGGSRFAEDVVNSGIYADRTRPDATKGDASALVPMRTPGSNEKYRNARYAGDAIYRGESGSDKTGKTWVSSSYVKPDISSDFTSKINQ